MKNRSTLKPKWKKHIKEVPVHLEPEFRAACAKAGIAPSKRQLKKWHKRLGLAWATANHV